MKHIIVPVSEVMALYVNPDMARINPESTLIMAFCDNNLHVLVGDFKGIDSGASLEEILKRNLRRDEDHAENKTINH